MNDESIDFADSRMDVSFFLSSLSDFANFDEEDFFLEDFVFVSTEASTSALREEEAADPPFPNIAIRLGRTPRPAAVTSPPVKEEADDQVTTGYKVVKFETSPKMSTYLVAIVVGEYEYVEDFQGDVKVRVYTPLGKTEQGTFALESSKRAIQFYNDFFGVHYPLKKYDCIAIADFQCGAMENWGLITVVAKFNGKRITIT